MNATQTLPSREEMYQAVIDRNRDFEGLFVVGVKTTGVFCRPGCPARRPLLENVRFFRSAADAVTAGFRPCRRCRPLEPVGANPDWLRPLLVCVEEEPARRWTDADIRSLGVEPARVRRWFKDHHGMTFQAYLRTQRLGAAVGRMHAGEQVTHAALESGYESLSGFRDALKQWLGDSPTQASRQSPIAVDRILTPLGPMIAAAGDEGLCLLEFADRRMLPTQFQRVARLFRQPIAPGQHAWIEQTRQELDEYFAGARQEFEAPLRSDGTPFQTLVWDALRKLPYGTTMSYEQLARAIGRQGAQRAVGRANGDNRFAIVIPCHRIVRSDGTLCGYGGGVWRKRWLLDHERNNL
jgi:AraC family transcriptional regulator of adaptative response/methylated-DNA-[protein]-cysteine methyltransferase